MIYIVNINNSKKQILKFSEINIDKERGQVYGKKN